MIIDGDSHMYELPSLWEERLSAAERHLALRIEPDDLGYSFLTFAGQRLMMVVPTVPSDPGRSGEVRQRYAAGLPAASDLYDEVPRDYWEPTARVRLLDRWGIDEAVVFPHFQVIMEDALRHDGDACRANMSAWNRWAIEATAETRGRLRPVGNLRMHDRREWGVEEVRRLGAGGVRMAAFVPGLIDAKPPSHPDNDVVWRAFVEAGVSLVWHPNLGHRFAIADALDWEADIPAGFGVTTGLFLRLAGQLTLCDMVFNGVFDRHPELRIVVSEFGVDWLDGFVDELDVRYETLCAQQGQAPGRLRRKPSEYFVDHVVVVASCPTGRDLDAIGRSPYPLAFGSDYPHGCGMIDPVHAYRALLGDSLGTETDAFYGDRLRDLLGDGVTTVS